MTRDERQNESINRWNRSNGIGTLEAATGYGKTRCAELILDKVYNKYKDTYTGQHFAIVIVPTIELKQQWEAILSRHNIKRVSVRVINGLVQSEEKFNSLMLILDEIH